MLISCTESMNFDRCRRMWALTSFNGESLTRVQQSPALALGTLFHKTLADWLEYPDIDPEQLCLVHYAEMYEEARNRYHALHGVMPFDRELASVASVGELCRAMIRNYRDYYKSPLPVGYTCVMPEQTLVLDIPGSQQKCKHCDNMQRPIGCEQCNGTGVVVHQLECTLDAIVSDARGNIYVLDHKTYGNRPKLNTIEHAYQFRVYCWAATQLLGSGVRGFLYDGAWKREEPPKGRTFDDLFLRIPVTYNQAQQDEIAAHLALKSKQMYMADDALLDFNRHWMGCFDCNVEDICTAMSRGEDVSYVKERWYTRRERTTAFADDSDSE